MRLPFFWSSKAEPAAKVAVAPPRPTPAPNLHLAETQVITSTTVAEQPSEPSVDSRHTVSRVPTTNGQTIPVALSSISQQLPSNFLAAVPSATVARLTVSIPAEWVLPQLARGRITITLADLLPLLPKNLTDRPFPTGNSQHAIVLPLADIVAALPTDLLQHQNQTEVNLDAPEYTQFPKLIDDSAEPAAVETPAESSPAEMEETVAIRMESVAPPVSTQPRETTSAPPPEPVSPREEPTTSRSLLAPTMAKPIPPAGASPSQSPAPQPSSNGNDITVSLRSLVAVMPDQYFVCPRTDLWRRIDLDTRIALPQDLVVPQLKIARVRLPLAVAIGLMPRSILASPLPSISEETIPIALQEIVSQLPPQAFASQSKVSDLHEIDFSDSEIPTPFAEKNFAPATVEIRTPERSRSQPTATPGEPEATPESIEIPADAFGDEGLSVFAEKPVVIEPTTTPAEVETATPAVAEPETVEPAAEPPATAPEAPEHPVITESPRTETPPPATTEAEVQEPVPAKQAPVEPILEVTTPVPATTEQPVPAEPQSVELAAEVAAPAPEAVEQPTTNEPTETVEPTAISEEPEEIDSDMETTTSSTAPAVETPESTEPEAEYEAQVPQPTAATSGTGMTADQFLVNLNNATVADLARIEGIGPVQAQSIIEYRNTHGGFKSLDDLRGVPGIGRRLLRTLAGPPRRGLNRLLGVEHNEELTLQEVVRLAGQLKGVAGCILAMSDGVFLTGELPPHLDQETISVFAPQLFRKVGRYMKELRAGHVTRLSVFTDQQPLSIFRAQDIFLIVVHDNRHFSKALLRRCERISQELARMCHQRAVV